ncbi:hypothetical protein AAFF_G00320070 [Aldrovandia affinis]|uniref:Uncharacterized protein n=1 Tax=Aldrovandia affinis TaxID=143900 RepID=A0AAD7SMR5_9TELE|nr:hypothetical protein AAFF_G00320070 [Aldrovandia affinis]
MGDIWLKPAGFVLLASPLTARSIFAKVSWPTASWILGRGEDRHLGPLAWDSVCSVRPCEKGPSGVEEGSLTPGQTHALSILLSGAKCVHWQPVHLQPYKQHVGPSLTTSASTTKPTSPLTLHTPNNL